MKDKIQNSFWKLDLKEWVWEEQILKDHVIPRYHFSLEVVERSVILIGGATRLDGEDKLTKTITSIQPSGEFSNTTNFRLREPELSAELLAAMFESYYKGYIITQSVALSPIVMTPEKTTQLDNFLDRHGLLSLKELNERHAIINRNISIFLTSRDALLDGRAIVADGEKWCHQLLLRRNDDNEKYADLDFTSISGDLFDGLKSYWYHGKIPNNLSEETVIPLLKLAAEYNFPTLTEELESMVLDHFAYWNIFELIELALEANANNILTYCKWYISEHYEDFKTMEEFDSIRDDIKEEIITSAPTQEYLEYKKYVADLERYRRSKSANDCNIQ